MRLLSGILFLILPIFSQAAPKDPSQSLEQIKNEWLAKTGALIFFQKTPTIYYHCYEHSCQGSYGRLVVNTIVKVAVKKTRTSKFIIGLAQTHYRGTYYLVPFVEDPLYPTMGTQRLKMKIVEDRAENYETLDQDDVVNRLFFNPIESKYLFSAKVVEYKDSERKPKMIGERQDPQTSATYRRFYMQNYPVQTKGTMP